MRPVRARQISEQGADAQHLRIDQRLRGVDAETDGRLQAAAQEEARPDGRRSVPVPSVDVLPLGRAVAQGLPGAGGARRRRPAVGGRSARGELRRLVRFAKAAGLGGQRLRRSLRTGLHERPRAAGGQWAPRRGRGENRRRGEPGVRTAARRLPGGPPHRSANHGHRPLPRAGDVDKTHRGQSEDLLEEEARPQ